jgi:thiamine biosynthesis lipoprotein
VRPTSGLTAPPPSRRTLSDLGYDADYSLTASADPAPVPTWDSVDWNAPVLTTIEPVLIDVGAAGKGLLVDRVATIIDHHTHDFTIDASGDILHGGTAPIRVALEHPGDPTRAIGVIDLDPGSALCASATNRRAWGDGLHHVIDARTGRPTTDVIATWATAHFFAEPDALADCFQHEYVRMHADGRITWSSGLPGEIFT